MNRFQTNQNGQARTSVVTQISTLVAGAIISLYGVALIVNTVLSYGS